MITFKEFVAENVVRELRNSEVDKARAKVRNVAEQLAPKYDTYEEFAQAALNMLPGAELDPSHGKSVIVPNETGDIHISLEWEYNNQRPEWHDMINKSWDQYGKERAEGKHTSRDGWTGD